MIWLPIIPSSFSGKEFPGSISSLFPALTAKSLNLVIASASREVKKNSITPIKAKTETIKIMNNRSAFRKF